MSVLVEFAMFPTDKGESVSSYVSRIILMMEKSKASYRLTPMGTVFETETMKEALEIIDKAYQELEPDCNRVYSSLNFDIRKGKNDRLESKIKSIEEKIGTVKK
ncbi:MAG TPA: MTH1187 family thiamine-binding protein [Bacteroidales bacterium]|nr:MTH1187 family thiamine-binding protein [Bacteroidales bacterium]